MQCKIQVHCNIVINSTLITPQKGRCTEFSACFLGFPLHFLALTEVASLRSELFSISNRRRDKVPACMPTRTVGRDGVDKPFVAFEDLGVDG